MYASVWLLGLLFVLVWMMLCWSWLRACNFFSSTLDSFSDLEARSLSRFGLEWSYWITSTYSTLSFEAGNHAS